MATGQFQLPYCEDYLRSRPTQSPAIGLRFRDSNQRKPSPEYNLVEQTSAVNIYMYGCQLPRPNDILRPTFLSPQQQMWFLHMMYEMRDRFPVWILSDAMCSEIISISWTLISISDCVTWNSRCSRQKGYLIPCTREDFLFLLLV